MLFDGRRSPLDRIQDACVTALVGALALYGAVWLLRAIWPELLIVGLVAGGIAGLLMWWRQRCGGW